MKVCSCTQYEENMQELRFMLHTQIHCKGGYKGEPFEYCPWCGTKLIVNESKGIRDATNGDR